MSLTYQEALFDLLEFWSTKMVDEERGGFLGRIDGDNVVHKDEDKGLVLNTRILWTFSKSYNATGDERYLAMANRAYNYLKENFIDINHDGLFWSVTCQGRPANKKKQVYGQAFAIYALAEYYKTGFDEEALQRAIDLFKLIESKSKDPNQSGYIEAFQEDWSSIEDLRLSDKDVNSSKTMNTHLHILEAYTTLYLVSGRQEVGTALKELIDLIYHKFYNKKGFFNLFFDDNWELQSQERSYGHDIESAWLIYEAVLAVGKEQVGFDVDKFVLEIAEATLPFIDKDGGLLYEGTFSEITNREKHWWPQMESMIGFNLAFEISQNDKYLEVVSDHWRFVQERIIDHVNGEWIWGIDEDGSPMNHEDKAGPWKGPYHNGRALLILAEKFQ